MNVNTTTKCIVEGAFLNHLTHTQHLGKECAKKMLGNRDETGIVKEVIALVSEINITAVTFQNLPKSISRVIIKYYHSQVTRMKQQD